MTRLTTADKTSQGNGNPIRFNCGCGAVLADKYIKHMTPGPRETAVVCSLFGRLT